MSSAIASITDRVRERVRLEGVELTATVAHDLVRDEVQRYSERALGGSVPLLADEASTTRQVLAILTGFGPLEGKPHGRSPYGMMRVDGRDVPDPTTAPVLRELARRVLEGESLRSLARDLTERGVPGPGSPTWNSTIIRQALLRPSYAGLRQYQGKVIGATNGEAVFDRDTHDRLVALLTDPSRKQNHRGRAPLYLLSGVAKCGLCGGTMRSQIGHVTTTKSGAKRQPPS